MSLETYVIKGSTKVIDRFFDLPLDYNDESGPKIRIFVRHLIPLDKAKTPEEQAKLPYLLYLQGGPGSEVSLTSALTLAPPIHEHGYQTLWLDPRGTGLSTPFSADLVRDKSDQEIFEYLKHFRADNIVRDCEAIRKALIGEHEDPADRKWTILGQSFGGFCSLTYLSFFPEGLKEAFITGGLAPLIDHPDPVYLALERKVTRRNDIYYQKYPADVKRVRDVLTFLDSNEVTLPNGGTLTPSRFLQLGIEFGSKGGIDRIHQLVLRSSNDLDLYGKLTYGLLQSIQATQTMDSNPIFAILHEPIYCQGRASNWAAERVLSKFPQYQWSHIKHADTDTPAYFFGEMVLPSMFDDFANLRPLKGAAELLARYSDWPKLYDLGRLAKNEVKVTAATYYDDIYVEFGLAQETAAAVKNTEQFISNEYFHGAIRTDGPAVFKQLFRLSKREYD